MSLYTNTGVGVDVEREARDQTTDDVVPFGDDGTGVTPETVTKDTCV